MIKVDIPGFGNLRLKNLVCDFSGTLSFDGKLIDGALDRLEKLTDKLHIYIITADTHGNVKNELGGKNFNITLINGDNEHLQKKQFIVELGTDSVVAIGNGANDYKMLNAAKVGIAVCLDEGLSTRAMLSSDIVINSIIDALDLLLYPNRLKATLRF